MMPRVFIGMPVRNGTLRIRQAIDSLRNQTFKGWRLVISDNASSDDTVAICREIASDEPRISVIRQKADIGAVLNFQEVLRHADSEFFMWAASDDRWHPEFLKTCITTMDANPSLGMAFTGVENIDIDGHVVRRYPDLPKLGGPPNYRTVSRYLLSREVCGKANLIYSVYRLELCRRVAQTVGLRDCWGGDMAFTLGAIARGGISINPNVYFQKRWSKAEVATNGQKSSSLPPPKGGIFPLERFREYRAALLASVSGTHFSALTALAMDYRMVRERVSRRLSSW